MWVCCHWAGEVRKGLCRRNAGEVQIVVMLLRGGSVTAMIMLSWHRCVAGVVRSSRGGRDTDVDYGHGAGEKLPK